MLTFGAIVTLIAGLVYVIDFGGDLVNHRPWARRAVLAAVYLALFSGFYAARVMLP